MVKPNLARVRLTLIPALNPSDQIFRKRAVAARYLLSRGDVIVRDGKLQARKGRGAFLECSAPDTLL